MKFRKLNFKHSDFFNHNTKSHSGLKNTMLISKTLKQFKDRWQTPIEVFRALDAEFTFKLDAAADENNALCKAFLSEKTDALKCDWNSDGAIFCNPPYSNIKPWVNKAAEQCRKQKKTIVMLLPSDTSTAWFHEALDSVHEVRFITGEGCHLSTLKLERKARRVTARAACCSSGDQC